MFPAIVILPCLHLDRALLHKRPSLSSKPRVTGGKQGPESWGYAQLRMTPPVMSATGCPPMEMHRDREKWGERPSLADTSFQEWWHFLCVIPSPIPPLGRDRELEDNTCSLSLMGDGKIVTVMFTIKMNTPQASLMWPVTSLKPQKMEAPYYRYYTVLEVPECGFAIH